MMKRATSTFPTRLWRGLALASAFASTQALAWQTDISQSPIVQTTGAQTKPNIMLLMDASTSMSYTHMPDQVELVTGIGSIGYKSAQCNSLYYDPQKTYPIPKRSDGTLFTGWASLEASSVFNFNKVRAKGFGDYSSPADTTELDLATQFRAYDLGSLENGGFQDTAQAAYYYVHDSNAQLDYNSAQCRTADTGVSKAADGGGLWTRKLVSATSGIVGREDERQNFAIWYSFYRDRISLIKSAASLAFNPLNDTFRIGFITVQPKNNRDDPAINPDRYLPIADFNIAQRTAWYAKLFSQPARGTSPAREGLARVGRHYAGRQDGINTGMTGDPLQHSCQQNFTIMTTDGYWNTQSESPTGGPVRIDGTTKIDQYDGDTADVATSCPSTHPDCPHPIHDGHSSSVKTDISAKHVYEQLTCGLSGRQGTYFTRMRGRSWYMESFVRIPKTVSTWTETKDQDVATRYQTTKKQSRAYQTTEQYSITTFERTEEKYKIRRAKHQSSKTSAQQVETSKQHLSRQYQVFRTDTTIKRRHIQHRKIRTQWREVREQKFAEVRVFREEKKQRFKQVYRWLQSPREEENYQPTESCTETAEIKCRRIQVTASHAVAFDSCTGNSQNASTPFEITECTVSVTQPLTAVAACSQMVGTHDAGGVGHMRTICSDDPVSAAAATPVTCTNSTHPVTKYRTICTNPAGANNQTHVGIAIACTNTNGTTNGPNYVKVTCSKSIDETTYPNTACTSSTDTAPPFITVDCSTPVNINDQVALLASCGPSLGDTIGPNNLQRTCTADTPFPRAAVDQATCTPIGGPFTVGTVRRTCEKEFVGSSAFTAIPVDCVITSGDSATGWKATECDTPSGTNYTNKPVPNGSCSISNRADGPNHIERSCSFPSGTNGTVFVPPGGCATNPGTSSPYIKVDCSGPVEIEPLTPVLPADCTAGNSGANDYIETTCERTQLQAPTTADCVAGNTGYPDYIQTDCGTRSNTVYVESCTEGSSGPAWNRVTCARLYTPNVLVATCTAQPKSDPNWMKIDCDFPVVFGPQLVKRSDCMADEAAGSGNGYTKTECTRVKVDPVPVPVALGCTDQLDGTFPDFYEKDCEKGPNYQPVAVLKDCAAGTIPADGSNSYTQTVCTKTDVGSYTPEGACAEAPSTGRVVTCGTAESFGATTQKASCVEGPILGGTRKCSAQTVVPPVESATCTPGPLADNSELISCGPETAVGAAFDDPTCVDGEVVGTRIKRCETTSGSGHILRRTTTRTRSVVTVSGGAPATTPTVTDSPVGVVDTACKPIGDPAVTLPDPSEVVVTVRADAGITDAAVDPWCTTLPCSQTILGPGGSKNSLAPGAGRSRADQAWTSAAIGASLRSPLPQTFRRLR